MQKIKRNFNRYMAMFMAILTLSGVAPLHVFATQNEQSNATASIFVNGEEVIANEDGSFFIGDNLNYEQPVFTHEASTSSTYGTVGAEHVASQIQNTANILIDTTQMTSNEDGTYTATIVSAGEASLIGRVVEVTPSYEYEVYIALRTYYFGHAYLDRPLSSPIQRAMARVSGTNVGRPNVIENPAWQRAVSIGNTSLSSLRYFIYIDGVRIEAFCVDPELPGGENPNAPAYVIVGNRNDLLNALRYGYPNNSYRTSPEYDSYATRVAVAYEGGSTPGQLTGDQSIIADARNQIAGNVPFHWSHRQIFVNTSATAGSRDSANATGTATVNGGVATSEVFTTTGSATLKA